MEETRLENLDRQLAVLASARQLIRVMWIGIAVMWAFVFAGYVINPWLWLGEAVALIAIAVVMVRIALLWRRALRIENEWKARKGY